MRLEAVLTIIDRGDPDRSLICVRKSLDSWELPRDLHAVADLALGTSTYWLLQQAQKLPPDTFVRVDR